MRGGGGGAWTRMLDSQGPADTLFISQPPPGASSAVTGSRAPCWRGRHMWSLLRGREAVQ